MYNTLIKNKILKKPTIPGNIQIIDSNNNILALLKNDLESVDSNRKDLKPGNFLIINNSHFRITLSCNYINTWVNRGKRASCNKKRQHDKSVHNHKNVTMSNHK